MKNIRLLYLKKFSFLVVKFSIYLKRRVFVMRTHIEFNLYHSLGKFGRRKIGDICLFFGLNNSLLNIRCTTQSHKHTEMT